ncbi:MAG: universal stress protein [Phycisphaeraceae bacterium]|nr:universal stress protein [Phycisphaeraceae bacterium]
MNRLKSIVVGVDFSACSAVALGQAARIGAWNRSSVTAVHVIDTMVALELEDAISRSGGAFFDDKSAGAGSVRQQLLDDTKRKWVQYVDAANIGEGVDFKAMVESRLEGIVRAAKDAEADLLVLGAVGEGKANVGMGTVASAAVRRSPCSVLLVRESKGVTPFKTVVCCVDFSKTSLEALEKAARLAAQDSAALHVVHVFYPPWHVLHYRAPTPEADPAFRKQYTDMLHQRLVQFGQPIEHELQYVKPKFVLIDSSDHRYALPEYLQREGADLVVLGTRGHSNLRDFFLGSTAEKILRDVSCSVLAVRPTDSK